MNIAYITGKILEFNEFNNAYLIKVNDLAIYIEILSNNKIGLNNQYNFYILTNFTNSRNIEIKYFAFDKIIEKEYFQKLINIKGIGKKYAVEIFKQFLNNQLNENSLHKFYKIDKSLPKKILKIFN